MRNVIGYVSLKRTQHNRTHPLRVRERNRPVERSGFLHHVNWFPYEDIYDGLA
ncbi:hypothetical protein R6G85_00320 [Actinotignum urinale]|uniref:hypothetical protein n=1 Tax=Actinotignum urinale TaxID=190146 RepID=UPI002A7F4636|nr:hypothetical protein [Actinotignum urinale]MDY5150936.1 hypothetical protein [Actinotignum urinale]